MRDRVRASWGAKTLCMRGRREAPVHSPAAMRAGQQRGGMADALILVIGRNT